MIASAKENEIVMRRVFDAPRELVYEMWTKPEHIVWWWGPRGFRTTIETMDVRVGGEWRFVMHGPDGTDYPNHNVYRVVDRPSRLAYTHVSIPKHEMDAVFEDLGGKTAVIARMTFESAELRDRVAKEFGAVEGLQQTLARLAEIAESHYASKTSEPEIVVSRTFDAPRDLVFRAHTDPDMLGRWWGPFGSKNLRCEIDPRPGGTWRVDQEYEGRVHGFSGEYREVLPPERLVYTFEWSGKPGNVATVTAIFAEAEGKTRLTTITRMPSTKDRNMMLGHGAIGGALQSYERLDAALAGAS